jgi:uncharacterized protein (DUF433 family)
MSPVDQRDGGYYVAGSRVSLDSVVYAYRRGESAEDVVDSFPSLDLNRVNGAFEFYLANRDLVDGYLREQQRKVDQMRAEARRRNPELHARIALARPKMRV